MLKLGFSKLEIEILRFQNHNYLTNGELKLNYATYFPYYYDLNEQKFKQNDRKERVLFLMTFDIPNDQYKDDQFWYYKEESLAEIKDISSKLYIKMGTGGVAPCQWDVLSKLKNI
ncbi:hypothetical protein [Sulfolobus sp. E11-6]|uniref:hypothetical protein n=1 Tax=Sulfolobus sp. E11-6 TaxID=2663020 RepID=UPI00138709D5|nr:hypothetical protein [Sulfolobus sp. E11-6]